MTPNLEVIAGIIMILIGSYGLVSAAKDAYTLLKRRKGGAVPNMKYIHSSPVQRYQRPAPTIETQYGRDLIHISTNIFSRNIDQGVDWAVNRAGSILNECNRKCIDIDIENVDKKISKNLAAQEALK